MIRFAGLDGLRGWLAWTVVLNHIVYDGGIGTGWVSRHTAQAARLAVMVFIILSGFVITHLVIEKEEPYGLYLARRALRIYPAYLFALLLAIGTTFLTFRTYLAPDGVVDPVAMAHLPHPQPGVLMFDWLTLNSGAYFTHLLLHLTMLHGMFAQSYLPNSEFMFLAPAWSLSLEWQFYLVAPFVIRAARGKVAAIGLVLLALVLALLYRLDAFGHWGLPSFLPGAGLYFGIGIASRLLVTGQPFRFSAWAAASLALLAAGFVILGGELLPALIWIVFLAASRCQPDDGRLAGASASIFTALFESRPARHLGEASYSTYLVHYPLLQFAMFVAVRGFALTPPTSALFAGACTLLSTWVVSRATWRWIELPFIARGRQLGSKGPSSEAAAAGAI